MSDMDTRPTDSISAEQLRKWLNRDAGKVHGDIMHNLNEILILAIKAKERDNG